MRHVTTQGNATAETENSGRGITSAGEPQRQHESKDKRNQDTNANDRVSVYAITTLIIL